MARTKNSTPIPENELRFEIPAISVNEGTARSIVSSFVSQMNPTIEELADIKCSVSEAVTNCIVHGYGDKCGIIYISVKLFADRLIRIEVKDKGVGIDDVKTAMKPLFTTDTTGERSGMGFAVMESFSDSLRVRSNPGKGTCVIMTKKLSSFIRVS